jgi:hypothetical protein
LEPGDNLPSPDNGNGNNEDDNNNNNELEPIKPKMAGLKCDWCVKKGLECTQRGRKTEACTKCNGTKTTGVCLLAGKAKGG